jgi:uncharacterized protein (DUF433 family)
MTKGSMMDWKEHIFIDPKVLNGQARFKGTQITVQRILEKSRTA